MAKTTFAFSSFTSGELSPRLDGRIDLEKYFSGTKTLENMVIHPHGGASRRPGTKFISEVKTSANTTRLIPFEFSTTQTYIMEFGNEYIRFFKDNGIITEAAKTISGITKANPGVVTASSHGYSNGDYVIISSVVGMTELNGRQFKVAGVTTNTFQLQDMDGNNFDTSSLTTYASAGSAFKIYQITSPYTTAQLFDIKFAQSADVMYLVHPDVDIRKLTRTGHTSWTLATVSISGSPSPGLSGSDDRPSSVTFFEQRLVFAGTNNNPQSLWFSKAGAYENFTTGTNATDAMIYTIASNQVNAIRFMSNQTELLIGTTGGEFIATSGTNSEPITPTNIQITRQTNYGAANVDAIQIANVTMFLQRAKRKVREMVYNYEVDGFIAPDMTILAEHITEGGLTSFAYQQEPDSILWATRADGTLLGLTYQRNEKVVGWHRHILGGFSDSGKSIVRSFKSFTANSTNVSTTNNTITISSHGFSTGDPVYYFTESNAIGGITTDLLYFAIATDSNTLKLATTSANATAGTAVDLTTAPGSDTTQYIVKGVNLATNVVYSASHGLATGDHFYYELGGTGLNNITDKQKYFVKKIDKNQFKIAADRKIKTFVDLTYDFTVTTARTDKILLDAAVESVAVIPSDQDEYQLYLLVKRYVNGSTRRFVEFLTNFEFGEAQDNAFFVDSGLTYDDVPTSTISGLDHLEGETVSILADGATHADKTVSGGNITLDRTAQKVHVGLNYNSILQTLRIEAGSQQGVAQSKIKRINEITVRLHKTLGVEVGGDLDNMENIPFRSSAAIMGSPIDLFSGDKKIELRDDYNTDGHVFVRQSQPLPLTVLSIYPEITVYD
tara:strand:- start:5696 stop:8218 length:2523 start_codon:yes stop_codon:yes gene_type:complete